MRIPPNLCALLLLLLLATDGNANFTQIAERSKRPNLVSFKSLDRNVLLGLDLVVPFLTMPVGKNKDKNGNERALINIDLTAIIVSGLITGGSLVVGHLFRSLGILAAESKESNNEEEIDRTNRRADLFEPFKLVYANSTGHKIETSLSEVFESLEEIFLEKDIDLSACIQKAICTMVYEAHVHLQSGKANGVDKIIDGFVNLQWLQSMLEYSILRSAIDAGKHSSGDNCNLRYQRCSWTAPHLRLYEILKTYVKYT